MKSDVAPGEIVIHGHCDERFSSVKEVFAGNFRNKGEVGASFAATLDGEPVIDIWAGYADAARTRPWERDTVACVYSTTKTMAALCALLLADRGLLDLDAPVASYWPEFAQAGKGEIPVKYLLSHQSGVAGFDERIPPEALYDWDRIVGLLAAQKPWWTPGTRCGYHAITQGYLVGEVVRRITGKTIGAYFSEEIAGPLRADCHIGLPEEDAPRAAEMIRPPVWEPGDPRYVYIDPESTQVKMQKKVMYPVNDPDPIALSNTPGWRAAEIPSANGFANARGLARMASALAFGEVDGTRLFSTGAIDTAYEEQCHGVDYILMLPVRWALGFLMTSEAMPFGPNPHTLIMGGGGGSYIIADRDARLSHAYVMNNCLGAAIEGDTRGAGLGNALYAALQADHAKRG